jgi:octaprenyl-diphosphate synthase
LVGDYLISQAFSPAGRFTGQPDPSWTSCRKGTCIIAEGEVLQLINQRDPATTEERYMEVIYGKTAKLFECAAEAGASLGNPALHAPHSPPMPAIWAPPSRSLTTYWTTPARPRSWAKTWAMTWPKASPPCHLIQAIKLLPDADAQLIRDAIRTGGLEHLDRIVTLVRDCGALDYTMARAREESELALSALKDVPASPWRQALEDLTRLALARNS